MIYDPEIVDFTHNSRTVAMISPQSTNNYLGADYDIVHKLLIYRC